MLAFLGCFKKLWIKILLIYNYMTSHSYRKEDLPQTCDIVNTVTLLHTEQWFLLFSIYPIFILVFWLFNGTSTVLCDDSFNFMPGGSYAFRCNMSYLNFPHHFCPGFHTERITAFAWPIMNPFDDALDLLIPFIMNWTLSTNRPLSVLFGV